MNSLRCAALALFTLAAGCSASGGSSHPSTGSGATEGSGGAGGDVTISSSSAGGSGGLLATGGSGGGGPEVAEVYGNSPDTLYKLDPMTSQVTTIGPFQGC